MVASRVEVEVELSAPRGCAGDASSEVAFGDDLEQAHAAAAGGTGEDVDGEDAPQQLRPAATCGGARGGGAAVGRWEERELFAVHRGAAGDDLGAQRGVAREHAVVPDGVTARATDEGTQAGDEVERVEQDGAGAVPPGGLEAITHPAVAVQVEAVLGELSTVVRS